MERFRTYLGRTVDPQRLADAPALDTQGFRPRWIPEPLGEFDEIEVSRELDGERDLVVTVAVEQGKVARILFGWGPAGDDDADRRGFEEAELGAVLEAHGDAAAALLDAWCPG
jgi:hypothetical protein